MRESYCSSMIEEPIDVLYLKKYSSFNEEKVDSIV